MTVCAFCGGSLFVGVGDMRTCANPRCARFVTPDPDPIREAFERQRAQMSDEERRIEAQIRIELGWKSEI